MHYIFGFRTTYVLFCLQCLLLALYCVDLILGCIGVGNLKSFFVLQEGFQTDFFPAYWGWYVYTACASIGALAYIGFAFDRLYDEECCLPQCYSLASLSFTLSLSMWCTTILMLELGVNQWLPFAFEIAGAISGIYTLYAIQRFRYPVTHYSSIGRSKNYVDPSGNCQMMCGTMPSTVAYSEMMVVDNSSGEQKVYQYGENDECPAPVNAYQGWPLDRLVILPGLLFGWHWMLMFVFLGGAIVPQLVPVPTVPVATDPNGDPITDFTTQVRLMSMFLFPIPAALLLIISIFTRSLGAAMALVGVSLFYTIRYTELFYYGIGGMALGLVAMVLIMWRTYRTGQF